MNAWTPQDWLVFFGGLVTVLTALGTGVTTIILQLRGNAKTEAAKSVSEDNNIKINAIAAQTNNIADAVPGASTAPTDAIVNSDPATAARKAGA
jgi:hypothetical protein